jgi:hypothetical protein
MQDASLHRLPVSSLIQFVNEVPRGDFGPVADFDDLPRPLVATGALKGAMSMLSIIAPMASQVRRRHASPQTCHTPRAQIPGAGLRLLAGLY